MRTATLPLLFSLFWLVGCGDQTSNKSAETIRQADYFAQTIKQADHFRPAQEKRDEIKKRHTVYVPAYSHVYTSTDKIEVMGITLSIRNTDANNSLLVDKILYYNTGGDLIETFLSSPHTLDPMASIDFVVNLTDMRGGSGANFIIEWSGREELTNPVIQAVMVNVSGPKGFAFAADGVTVQ